LYFSLTTGYVASGQGRALKLRWRQKKQKPAEEKKAGRRTGREQSKY